MRKSPKLLSVFLSLMLVLFGSYGFTACGEEKTPTQPDKDAYTITYHLNYDGASSPRTVSVPAGGYAVSWRPYRAGYEVAGWYTDPSCTAPYDFEAPVYADAAVYADWTAEAGQCVVTFDPNYDGAPYPETVVVTEGALVSENAAPELTRLGMDMTGWYADAACTVPWNFAADTVDTDTRLYAGFVFDDSIERDENGDPVFEGVTVNLWIGTDFDSAAILEGLANRFNRDETYRGKISINVSRTITDQNLFSLRYQQTPEKNRLNNTYYPVADIYNMAGIDIDSSKWFAGAAQDSYVEGQLYSVPLVGSVPYLIYNKALMAEYNGDNELPDTYSEFAALMQAAYAGEAGSNPSFHGIRTNNAWTFNEATSYAPFVQNDAEYYTYEDGRYVNGWDDEATFANAVTAYTNAFEILGAQGACHGASTGLDTEYTDDTAVADVAAGNALFGIVNMTVTSSKVIQRSSAVGVMPLSGLFADEGKAGKDQIPIHTQTLAFYRAQRLSNTELAAAAVVAEYLCANSYEFAVRGWYPLTRAAYEHENFQNPSSNIGELLLSVGDPDDFRTMYGLSSGKDLINSKIAHNLLRRVVDGDGTNIEATARMTMYTIVTEINR